MARNTEKRYKRVDLKGQIPTIDPEYPAYAMVWTNFPLKYLTAMDSGKMSDLMNFLSAIIVEWDGFDMELSPESIGELTSEEMLALAERITDETRNPPSKTSNDS